MRTLNIYPVEKMREWIAEGKTQQWIGEQLGIPTKLIQKACKKHGIALGVGGIRGDAELQTQLIELGARFLIAGSDTTYLAAAASKDASSLRELIAGIKK